MENYHRLKSTNLLERLNQEILRRAPIIRIFPNRDSANRLIGALLMDLEDEWTSSIRKYIKFNQRKIYRTLYGILYKIKNLTSISFKKCEKRTKT